MRLIRKPQSKRVIWNAYHRLLHQAMQDVVETNALLIHDKMVSGLTSPRDRATLSLAVEITQSLKGETEVISIEYHEALEDAAAAAEGEGLSAQVGERSIIGSLGNAFLAVGRYVWQHKGKVSVGGAFAVLKWMVIKETQIYAFLVAHQGSYAAWFKAMVEAVKPWLL